MNMKRWKITRGTLEDITLSNLIRCELVMDKTTSQQIQLPKLRQNYINLSIKYCTHPLELMYATVTTRV